tara:strand:+ start:272 stop:1138 length:867 start_codon:yes stop_codon:yes gene_type:complete
MATFNSSTGTPTKPVISGSSGQWGNLLNTIIDEFDADFTLIDTRIDTLEAVTHVTAFTGLSDTPSSYTSSSYVRANSGGTALEFVTPSITELSDTPSSLGSPNQILKMNSGATALEWASDSSGGGGIALGDLSIVSGGTANTASLSYNSANGQFTFTGNDYTGFVTLVANMIDGTKPSFAEQTVTPSANSYTNWSHGLGDHPDAVSISYKCTSADLGYSVGEIVLSHDHWAETNSVAFCVSTSTTNVRIYHGSTGYYFLPSKTNSLGAYTNGGAVGKWDLLVRAWKFN